MRTFLKPLLFLILLSQSVAAFAEGNGGYAYKVSDVRDLALIYQGGSHRIEWTQDQFVPYVTHTFADGHKDWLFDGFLFLEFNDGQGYAYASGGGEKKARKAEWEWLLGRIFEKGKSLDALDKCIEAEKKVLGEPGFKHKVVLGIASALPRQTDWGALDGDSLDFNDRADQVKACKWYIDRLLENFAEAEYKNIELSGLYWIDEDTIHCKGLPRELAPYVHSKGLKYVWIPYWKARGYDHWKEFGFDVAYQQPNYFFNRDVPYKRLDEACKEASKQGMAMEFEFDSKALYEAEDCSYDRLEDYIDTFIRNKVFEKSAIAYYTGSKAVLDMYKSKSPENQYIMDRLAKLIVERRDNKSLIEE